MQTKQATRFLHKRDRSRFKLLFFGSDSFSIRVLTYLLNKRICPIEVVTKPCSILDSYSSQNHVARHSWPLDVRASEKYKSFNIGIVASFGELIDPVTVNHFDCGLFNVHPSLLPQYRGSSPVQAAIKDGLSETGCSLMKIPPVPKFDIGDIIFQERISIKRREYAFELGERLADIGAVMVEKLLIEYDESLRTSRPQIQNGKSLARKIRPEDGLIKFKVANSDLIDRKVRAYTGTIDLFTYCLGGLKIELDQLRDPEEIESYNLDRVFMIAARLKNVLTLDTRPPVGTMFFHKTRNILCFKCADLRWLSFDVIRPESKSKMKALDFYNGYLSKVELSSSITDV